MLRRWATAIRRSTSPPRSAGDGPEHEQQAERRARELAAHCSRHEVRAACAGYLASLQAETIIKAAADCDGFVEQPRVIGDFALTNGVLAWVWCRAERRDELVSRVEVAFVLEE